MTRFRKRPIVIDAVLYEPGKGIEDGVNYDQGITFPYVKTLEGKMYISPGDWIITGVMGERYPCKPDIFEKTYEVVDGPDEMPAGR